MANPGIDVASKWHLFSWSSHVTVQVAASIGPHAAATWGGPCPWMQHDMGNAAWWFQTSLFQLENWKKNILIRDDTYLAGVLKTPTRYGCNLRFTSLHKVWSDMIRHIWPAGPAIPGLDVDNMFVETARPYCSSLRYETNSLFGSLLVNLFIMSSTIGFGPQLQGELPFFTYLAPSALSKATSLFAPILLIHHLLLRTWFCGYVSFTIVLPCFAHRSIRI